MTGPILGRWQRRAPPTAQKDTTQPPRPTIDETMARTYDEIMAREAARPKRPQPDYSRLSIPETMARVYDDIQARAAGKKEPQPDYSGLSIEDTMGRIPAGSILSAGTQNPAYQMRRPAFADAIAGLESGGQGDLAAIHVNPRTGKINAWGRYQIQKDGLIDAGAMRRDGTWTGRFGATSEDVFLRSPDAETIQQRTYDAYLDAKERQSKAAGNFAHEGIIIEKGLDQPGRRGQPPVAGSPIWLSKAALMGATHRVGAGWLAEYLRWAEGNGWRTFDARKPDVVYLPDGEGGWTEERDQGRIADRFLQAEDYLRNLQDVAY